MSNLNLLLVQRYKHYKQLHGTGMGSPVSVVVAEIVMQNIEEQALATYSEALSLWLRWMNGTVFCPLYVLQNQKEADCIASLNSFDTIM